MLCSTANSTFISTLRYPLRRILRIVSVQRSQPRHCSAQALKLPTADDEPKVYSDKIQKIVSQISNLTILEVSDLNELLKKTLNISDAPVMAVGALPGAGQPKEEEEEEVKVTKTSFSLKITKFDESKKVPLIKHVKGVMEGMNLVQAKKFVETLPAVVRADTSQAEAEKLKGELEGIGAVCEIE